MTFTGDSQAPPCAHPTQRLHDTAAVKSTSGDAWGCVTGSTGEVSGEAKVGETITQGPSAPLSESTVTTARAAAGGKVVTGADVRTEVGARTEAGARTEVAAGTGVAARTGVGVTTGTGDRMRTGAAKGTRVAIGTAAATEPDRETKSGATGGDAAIRNGAGEACRGDSKEEGTCSVPAMANAESIASAEVSAGASSN